MPNGRHTLTQDELLALEIEEAWQVVIDEDLEMHRHLTVRDTEGYRLMNLAFQMGYVKGKIAGQRLAINVRDHDQGDTS